MRGYQKRVICLKNIGSSVFEEAYFVIKSDVKKTDKESEDKSFINEANRIIEDSVGIKRKRKFIISLKESIIFITGFLISSIIFLILLK